MVKIPFFLSIYFACAVVSGFANIAMPQQPPDPAGDMWGSGEGWASLRIEEEVLRLDLTGRSGSFSRARYRIANPSSAVIRTDLYFITPFMRDVTVSIDGQSPATNRAVLTRAAAPWKITDNEYSWWARDREMQAVKFQAVFPSRAVTVVEVTFSLPAGYDNTLAETGVDPAAGGHALNWSKTRDQVGWYRYCLETAATFQGGIGSMNLEILVPSGAQLLANVEVTKDPVQAGASADGVDRYSGVFQGFPVPTIEARVIRRGEAYNLFGGTLALGLATDYAMYLEFMIQALLDVSFGNHQLSAGLEAHPLGTTFGLKIPILYTFVFGGRIHPYAVWAGDIRVLAGALIDLLPSTAAGLRLGLGFRFAMMILEIDYDFYPFDAARGYVGRMTFLYKISI